MVPFIGEVADAAKVARKADDIADVVKVAQKADNIVDAAKVGNTVRVANRSSKGTELLNNVSSPKLRNTIKEMYRPGAKIGDGGLADAVKYEIKTGELVGGKSHIQKGKERLRNLEKIYKQESLTQQDKRIIESLMKDLRNALGE